MPVAPQVKTQKFYGDRVIFYNQYLTGNNRYLSVSRIPSLIIQGGMGRGLDPCPALYTQPTVLEGRNVTLYGLRLRSLVPHSHTVVEPAASETLTEVELTSAEPWGKGIRP